TSREKGPRRRTALRQYRGDSSPRAFRAGFRAAHAEGSRFPFHQVQELSTGQSAVKTHLIQQCFPLGDRFLERRNSRTSRGSNLGNRILFHPSPPTVRAFSSR